MSKDKLWYDIASEVIFHLDLARQERNILQLSKEI